MKKILLALFSFIFVFSIVGCTTKTETKKEEKVIKMGFVPLKNSEKLVEDLKPISDYLSERLGVKVEAFTASNYIGVVEGLGSGSVDFGIIPPFSSLLAQKQSSAKPILTSKGKKVAFVDPSSSSGYIYPGAMLVEAGLNLDKDISYQFSGGHDKSLQLLLNKDVDVIATFDGVEDRYAKDFPQAKTDIQKLATSDMIPGVMVTTSSKMDKELQEKLEKALRDVENDPKMKELFTKMFSITGFTDVDQDAYKKVEATAKVMNVDLDKVK